VEDCPLYQLAGNRIAGVISEILRGKRELNIRQIRALSRHFHVSPAVFI